MPEGFVITYGGPAWSQYLEVLDSTAVFRHFSLDYKVCRDVLKVLQAKQFNIYYLMYLHDLNLVTNG